MLLKCAHAEDDCEHMMQGLPHIAEVDGIGDEILAARPAPDDLSRLDQRIAEQQADANQFARAYREQLGGLEHSLLERLTELEEHTRRSAEADFQFAADEIARERRRLKKKQARLESEADRVELRRMRTKLQRRRLATYFRLKRRQLRNVRPAKADKGELRKVVAERDALAGRLAEVVAQLEACHAESSDHEVEQLHQRLERALSDVRDLKRRNAELEQQIGTTGKPAPSGGNDWESQKQRMLAALEADDAGGETRTQDRLTIDGTIRITDEVIQAKDREIRELKERLEQQPPAVLLPSVEAMAEILDRDEAIRGERQRLKQLEVQWQEKLKRAEIDVSMERAKFARQQAELEELRRLQASQQDSPPASAEADEPKSPTRGRWLARLGLSENSD